MKCYCGKTLHDCTRMLCIHIFHRTSFIDNFHKRTKLLNSLADVIIFSCCSISMSYRNYEALRLENANKNLLCELIFSNGLRDISSNV